MDDTAFSCLQCASILNADGFPKVLTCARCGARMEVNWEARRVKGQIRDCDAAWELERQPFLVRDRSGILAEPGSSVSSILMVIIPGALATVVGAAVGRPSLLVAAALIWVTGIGLSVGGWRQADQFRRRKERYERQRRGLLIQLGHAQRTPPPP